MGRRKKPQISQIEGKSVKSVGLFKYKKRHKRVQPRPGGGTGAARILGDFIEEYISAS
jgi:hypothetical protein